MKWQYGLRKSGLTRSDPVRAVLKEGTIPDCGNRRGWFLSGGATNVSAPVPVVCLAHAGTPPVTPAEWSVAGSRRIMRLASLHLLRISTAFRVVV